MFTFKNIWGKCVNYTELVLFFLIIGYICTPEMLLQYVISMMNYSISTRVILSVTKPEIRFPPYESFSFNLSMPMDKVRLRP